ncbi:MAG TPA: M28 family metallopeptidase [Candidatus Saccharimonadia bacterium]|nr:M28 family metallopeptidase [Candidatus Saccharimonadia bacterium]
MRFLADDHLEGREAGTRGYDLAALYVATKLRELGVAPGGDEGSYYQAVPMIRGVRERKGARFSIERDGKHTALEFETDYLPSIHYTAGKASVTAPLVFVGQAVHAPELGHDDFAGVDLAGKIAVYFGNAPERFKADERAYFASSNVKLGEIAKRGAVGVVGLSDPRDEAKRPWEQGAKNWRRPGMRLLVDGQPVDDHPALVGRASLRAARTALLFEGARHDGAQVVERLKSGKLESFDLVGTATLASNATLDRVESRNVIGRWPGGDAALSSEHVVMTAHLDHVGTGAPINGDAIYNGALDNALGVAVMLEAVRRFAAAPPPQRSVLFIALTAEEKGLLGAEYFARNPTVARGSLVANVNMDMPILLAPQSDVVPVGVEHSTLQRVLERAAGELEVVLSPDPVPEEVIFVRSDQYPFVKQGVPAVYLNGGVVATDGSDAKATMKEFLKSHYHLPSDDATRPIDYPTAARLARLNHRIGEIIANDPERPRWNDGDFFGEKFGKPAVDAPR